MEDFMKNIVVSDIVQELLVDLLCEIEFDSLIEKDEYIDICQLVQATINEQALLLEPLEIAKVIEEAVMIYSGRNVKVDSEGLEHFNNIPESVEIAFVKQLGFPQKQLILN